jgi:hypothetical protein
MVFFLVENCLQISKMYNRRQQKSKYVKQKKITSHISTFNDRQISFDLQVYKKINIFGISEHFEKLVEEKFSCHNQIKFLGSQGF